MYAVLRIKVLPPKQILHQEQEESNCNDTLQCFKYMFLIYIIRYANLNFYVNTKHFCRTRQLMYTEDGQHTVNTPETKGLGAS